MSVVLGGGPIWMRRGTGGSPFEGVSLASALLHYSASEPFAVSDFSTVHLRCDVCVLQPATD